MTRFEIGNELGLTIRVVAALAFCAWFVWLVLTKVTG